MKYIEKTLPNSNRIWVCEECNYVFSDEEIRKDIVTGRWGHLCKMKKYRTEVRCESYLTPYLLSREDYPPHLNQRKERRDEDSK